jgi:hypothetical protein
VTMKTLLLALGLATSACGVAFANESANESRHSAIVDMPEVATLSHASPDTWHTLPPVQPDVRAITASLFAQVGPVEPTCDASSELRNTLSIVKLF